MTITINAKRIRQSFDIIPRFVFLAVGMKELGARLFMILILHGIDTEAVNVSFPFNEKQN
ncbi:hypothetical protein FHW16_003086 [Phyllobacterium myrsinacearum]|uniref:Uncharacterized protein n=1 Tax=Phyllobacterium myrsinacearum TaxID=28101 RepID=A0A839ESF6_9HYPH|nr:hypothetical protein [Phyllobacterium myrsinacearum]